MAGSLIALSAHRFGRAREELQTAELLLKNANFRSSINRSYRSVFMDAEKEAHARQFAQMLLAAVPESCEGKE